MDAATADTASPVTAAFNTFRAELDEHHARRERVIKKSRDITDLSKKAIFALHRARAVCAPLPDAIAREVAGRFTLIGQLFRELAPDLADGNGWRYQWQISPGVQEFIEALSFKHYLETGRIISCEEVCAFLASAGSNAIVTEADYMLGLFDLTGELMRFAITAIASPASAFNF
ncbi:hypothetical protein KEM52_003406, partial [Ascosphaera acerosa]